MPVSPAPGVCEETECERNWTVDFRRRSDSPGRPAARPPAGYTEECERLAVLPGQPRSTDELRIVAGRGMHDRRLRPDLIGGSNPESGLPHPATWPGCGRRSWFPARSGGSDHRGSRRESGIGDCPRIIVAGRGMHDRRLRPDLIGRGPDVGRSWFPARSGGRRSGIGLPQDHGRALGSGNQAAAGHDCTPPGWELVCKWRPVSLASRRPPTGGPTGIPGGFAPRGFFHYRYFHDGAPSSDGPLNIGSHGICGTR